jgi:hypothetical protein
LLAAYLAGQKNARKTTASPVAQVAPSNFDVVKELSTHAGRRATLLAYVVAATSFSMANGSMHAAQM